MKQLMMTLAAALFATAVVAEVTSANIVGYQTINVSGTYPCYGATFISVGNTNGLWHLGDITADGMDPDTDIIQFLDPHNLTVTTSATYCDAALAASYGHPEWQGWVAPGGVGGPSMNATALPAGTGFLSNFGSGNPITIKFAGEVVQTAISLNLTGLVYPLVANPVPANLTLGDITANGMDPDTDIIQFLDPHNLTVTTSATYCDAALAASYGHPEWQGWVAPGGVGGPSMNTTALPSGAAILCNIGSGNPVTMVFPSPMP